MPPGPPKALRIYVAGPYSADSDDRVVRHVEAAIDVAIRLFEKGHYPYVPHLTHYVDVRAKLTDHSLKWADFIDWDMAWLRLCDAVLVMAESRGVRLEVEAAERMGLQVFRSLDDVPASASDSSVNRIYYRG